MSAVISAGQEPTFTTNANTTYTAGTGSSNTGDTYSFGATGGTVDAQVTPAAASTDNLGRASVSVNAGAVTGALPGRPVQMPFLLCAGDADLAARLDGVHALHALIARGQLLELPHDDAFRRRAGEREPQVSRGAGPGNDGERQAEHEERDGDREDRLAHTLAAPIGVGAHRFEFAMVGIDLLDRSASRQRIAGRGAARAPQCLEDRRGLVASFLNPVAFDNNGGMTDDQGAAAIIRGMTIERGSEIEAAFVESLYDGFDREAEPTDLDIAQVLTGFVPLSKTMAEPINALRTWATGRARCATSHTVTERKLRKLAA